MTAGGKSDLKKKDPRSLMMEAGQKVSALPKIYGLPEICLKIFGKDQFNEILEDLKDQRKLSTLKLSNEISRIRENNAFFIDVFWNLSSFIGDQNIQFLDREELSSVLMLLALGGRKGSEIEDALERQKFYKDFLDGIVHLHNQSVTNNGPEPADQEQSAPRETLDDALAKKTADVLAALDGGGDEAATVRALFAAAGRIVETANPPQTPRSDEVDAPVRSPAGPFGHATAEAAAQFAAAASEPVPTVAPRLWSERDKKTEKNPAEFIRTVYVSCMANLGQHHLWTLDRGLYRRYVDWKDEPKELVNGKIKACDQLVEFGASTRLSDEERGRRAREQSNTTKAKKRAQQKAVCDTPPHLDH